MVQIIAGKDKGKTGKVIQALPAEEKVVVEGVNMRVRHMKPKQRGQKGQKVEFFAPVHISNVMYVSGDQATRLGKKTLEDGKRVRYAKKTGETVTE